MSTKHGISRLLQDLHELYYKLCAIDLRMRMKLYHRNTYTDDTPDISASLAKHFDKLAPVDKPNRAGTAGTVTPLSAKGPARHDSKKPPRRQSRGITRMVSTFFRPQKIFTSIKASDQYMGEKLKDSIWSHTHAATLHARQGNVSNAKLHAQIANDALKEAAHYMSEKDYKVLCDEVAMSFKELEEKS